jgi:hypothetical protein
MSEKLSDNDKIELDKAFTMEEIKDVVSQMEKNKAPWPDDIHIEFYRVCWDIIKHDLMDVFYDFHRHKIDLSRINYEIITLLPKGNDVDKI